MKSSAAEQQGLPKSFVVTYGTARLSTYLQLKKIIFSSVNKFNSAQDHTNTRTGMEGQSTGFPSRMQTTYTVNSTHVYLNAFTHQTIYKIKIYLPSNLKFRFL